MIEENTPFLTRLLVGVDGSAEAEQAVRWAARLAASTGAEVIVVHVLTFDRELIRDLSPETMTTWRRSLRRDLESRWIATLVKRGTRHRCEIVEAESSAAGILEAAKSEEVDLIIIGPRRHNALADRLHSSTATRLMQQSVHPVTLVPVGPAYEDPAS